jgi:hypothetical protein
MNELTDQLNSKDSVLEVDPLDSEVRILDWILYLVCNNDTDWSRSDPLDISLVTSNNSLSPSNFTALSPSN